jgi:predicted nucleic acid-binding protein
MNIVDSSGWLAYFADEPLASHFEKPLQDVASLIVPTITVYEVFKVVLREASEHEALQAVAAMQKGTLVHLNVSLATDAATLSLKYGLPMADSIILATGRACEARIWTSDSDFQGIDGAVYIS